MTDPILSDLQRSSLFAHLNPGQLQRLADHSSVAEFEAGDVVIQEKDEVHALYLVTAGHVDVTTSSMNREVALTQLMPGAFFGEVSLLSGKKATATVRAGIQGTRCILVERDALNELLEEDDTLRQTLEGTTLARAKDTIAKVLH